MSFRTLEVSNPAYESDGLRMITVRSHALGRRGDITLFVPPKETLLPNTPALLLLHGVYGSHWAWAFSGGAHHICAAMIRDQKIPPMVLVMPSDGLWGDGSGYLVHDTADYEGWIVNDVMEAARICVPEMSDGSPWGIAGLSMGGYGALRLGAKYPDRFVAASGHSSITRPEQMALFMGDEMVSMVFDEKEDSVLGQIQRTLKTSAKPLPRIRFDCGTEDKLLQGNRDLHESLTQLGVDHCYEEFPGGHTWDYWTAHLPATLEFFASALAEQKKAESGA